MKENLDKIEELEQTLFELRGEIAGGRHVPPGLRILSMVDNPEQQWFDLRQAAMDRLKEENEALMKRLKELEESGARVTQDHGEELGPRASWERINREKADLEDVVRQKEKRLLRLQQVCPLFDVDVDRTALCSFGRINDWLYDLSYRYLLPRALNFVKLWHRFLV